MKSKGILKSARRILRNSKGIHSFLYLQRGKAAVPPPCVPLIRGWSCCCCVCRRGVPPTIQAACRQKNLAKSYKNLANMFQNRGQNVPKSRSGGNLGGSWPSPGSKARLGWFLVASWAALGRFLASWRHMAPNLVATIHQNRSQIDAKMYCILESIFRSIFLRFLFPTCTPEKQQKSSRLAFSWFLAFELVI